MEHIDAQDVADPQRRRADDPDLQEDKDPLTYEVIGAAIEVHRDLGPGYLEALYEAALAIELTNRNIPYVRQSPVSVLYKGHSNGECRLDFLVKNELILELKAVEALAPIHTAQVISYLKASGKRKALLINFKELRLREGVQRIVL